MGTGMVQGAGPSRGAPLGPGGVSIALTVAVCLALVLFLAFMHASVKPREELGEADTWEGRQVITTCDRRGSVEHSGSRWVQVVGATETGNVLRNQVSMTPTRPCIFFMISRYMVVAVPRKVAARAIIAILLAFLGRRAARALSPAPSSASFVSLQHLYSTMDQSPAQSLEDERAHGDSTSRPAHHVPDPGSRGPLFQNPWDTYEKRSFAHVSTRDARA